MRPTQRRNILFIVRASREKSSRAEAGTRSSRVRKKQA
jgi:hypothetical protein